MAQQDNHPFKKNSVLESRQAQWVLWGRQTAEGRYAFWPSFIVEKSCYLYRYNCIAPKKSWENIFWITSVLPSSSLANTKFDKTSSVSSWANKTQLPMDLLHTPTILLKSAYYHPVALRVYSASLTNNILRFSDVCSSFKNSRVPEKQTVDDTLQVSVPYCCHLFIVVVSLISLSHLTPCSSPPIPCRSPVTSLATTKPLFFHCFEASKKQPML